MNLQVFNAVLVAVLLVVIFVIAHKPNHVEIEKIPRVQAPPVEVVPLATSRAPVELEELEEEEPQLVEEVPEVETELTEEASPVLDSPVICPTCPNQTPTYCIDANGNRVQCIRK